MAWISPCLLYTSLEEFGWQNRQTLLGTLSPVRQKYLEGLEETKLRRAMLWLGVHHWQPGGKFKLPHWDEPEIAELTGKLSTGAQHRLASLTSNKEKQKLIGTWLQTALRHRVESGGIRQNLPPIENAELQRFFREELSSQQREWLMPLSRDQRHRLLLRMYFLPPDRLAQLRPGQWPGWPQTVPNNDKPAGRPKAGAKRLKAQA